MNFTCNSPVCGICTVALFNFHIPKLYATNAIVDRESTASCCSSTMALTKGRKRSQIRRGGELSGELTHSTEFFDTINKQILIINIRQGTKKISKSETDAQLNDGKWCSIELALNIASCWREFLYPSRHDYPVSWSIADVLGGRCVYWLTLFHLFGRTIVTMR